MPDVYAGSPMIITAFFATFVKLILFVLFLKIMRIESKLNYEFFNYFLQIGTILDYYMYEW